MSLWLVEKPALEEARVVAVIVMGGFDVGNHLKSPDP